MQIAEYEHQEPLKAATTREGPIFEAIAQSIYGGRRKSQRQLCHAGNGDSLTSIPDLLDIERGIAKEVKGVGIDNYVTLDEVQIAKYILLQAGGYFPDNLLFDFEIFRHRASGLAKTFLSEGLDGLIEELANGIQFHLSLPFSLVYHLFSSGCNYTGRHEKSIPKNKDQMVSSWAEKAYTRILAPGLDALMAEPEQTIKSIGLSNRSYSVTRLRFPSHVKMMGEKTLTPISSFPSIVIRDVNKKR